MPARTGNRLVAIHQIFTFAAGVKHHGQCADVKAVRTDKHQVAQDARDFIEHHADVLGTDRHFDAQHPLDGQTVGMFAAQHRHVVETIHVGQRLQPGLAFSEFFGRPVQQADMWISALHHFAVHFQHHAQHTVCGRVLWAEIDRVILDIRHFPRPRNSLRERSAVCFHAAQCSPARKPRAFAQDRNASRHNLKSGNPCGKDDR